MIKLLMNFNFYLIAFALIIIVLELVFPWRKKQKFFRKELYQDYIFFIFNAFLFWHIFSTANQFMQSNINKLFSFISPIPANQFNLISSIPFGIQIIIAIFFTDFLDYLIHNLLHRINFLWRVHRLHHSIKEMDWVGNFRFHSLEIVVYQILKYLPLALMGFKSEALFVVGLVSLLIGNLNHSNLNISWGFMRFVFNSPRMHIWHHEKKLRKKSGVNFGVILSIWDWIFKTAYMSKEALQPEELGYQGEKTISKNIFYRLTIPFINIKKRE